jgi:ribosomal protein S18 acetylase RimI-like enzyme
MQPISNSFESPRGPIIIREATPADVMQFRELRLFALQEAPTAFSADYQAYLGRPMSFWEGRLNFDEYGIIFFAEHAGSLIGMMGIRQRESPKTKHSAEVFSVYVRPEWRGLHIAEALIDRCVQWAKTREVNILKLGVMATNTSAVRCYERCGFKIYGTEPRDVFYEGKYYDLHLMCRDVP